MISPEKNKQPYLIALVITVAVLAVLSVFFVRDYERARHFGHNGMHPSFLRSFRGQPLTADDASSTQVWMTFDYINYAFSLSPQYLQNNLAIADNRYPRLTISGYARDAKIAPAEALAKVQTAIQAYFATKP